VQPKIEKILEGLYQKGAVFDNEKLKKLKRDLEKIIKKDQSMRECLTELAVELKNYSEEFIYNENKVISGLSSCIYLPNSDGTYSINLYGGKTKYNDTGKEINEKTIFDLASITKLYTFLLTLKLIEKGYFKVTDKIKDLDSRFSNLSDYTIGDILKMAGEIRTTKRVDSALNEIEALDILKTTYVYDQNKNYNHYTDIGILVLSKVIEKLVSEKLQRQLTFEEIMNIYLLEPWGITNTMFKPDGSIYDIAGNGNSMNLVHDPKVRVLGGTAGSAGLFSNAEGIKKLSDKLFDVENGKYAKIMGTIIYPNSEHSNKGYAGIYQKHALGLNKTFVPSEYSKGSFAHQGFTGQVVVFDPNNKIMNSILVNSIYEDEARKPVGFMDALTNYQFLLTNVTLKACLLNKYYSEIGYMDNLDVKVKVK